MRPALKAIIRANKPSRCVATRCIVPYGYNGGSTALMSRSEHIARDDITSLQVVYGNWYIDTANNTGTFGELGSGTTAAIAVGLEYPSGTFRQILFAGSVSGSVLSGQNIVSDPLPVNIKNGDEFFIRTSWVNTGGIIYRPIAGNDAIGDRFEFTATDKTISGTIANGLAGYCFPPLAIIAKSNKKSVFAWGTSRCSGIKDTQDASGNMGIIERSIAPLYGICNGGTPSDSVSNVVGVPAFAKRAALANAYFSDIIIEHGVNDESPSISLATLQGRLQTLFNLFPTKRVHVVTVDPDTSSTDSWATTANQTIQWNSSDSKHLSDLNDVLRARSGPLSLCFDLADVMMDSHNSNKWKVDGTASKYTADGLHENQAGCLLIQSSGAINL